MYIFNSVQFLGGYKLVIFLFTFKIWNWNTRESKSRMLVKKIHDTMRSKLPTTRRLTANTHKRSKHVLIENKQISKVNRNIFNMCVHIPYSIFDVKKAFLSFFLFNEESNRKEIGCGCWDGWWEKVGEDRMRMIQPGGWPV